MIRSFDFDPPLDFTDFYGQNTRDGVIVDFAKKSLHRCECFRRVCVEYIDSETDSSSFDGYEDSETDSSSFDGETYLLDCHDFDPSLVCPEKSPMSVSEQLHEDEDEDEEEDRDWESLNTLLWATVFGGVAATDQQMPDDDKKAQEARLSSTVQGQTYKLFLDEFDDVTPTDTFLENLHVCVRKMA